MQFLYTPGLKYGILGFENYSSRCRAGKGHLDEDPGAGGHNVLSLVIGVLCVVVRTLIYMPFVAAAAKANIALDMDLDCPEHLWFGLNGTRVW